MIFVGYEPGSKGYQFWDADHQRIEISRDVKFNETLFPAQEAKKNRASMNDPPISVSDNDSDQSGSELVIPTYLLHGHPVQANLHQKCKPTRTHPLPHPRFHRARNLPDQDKNLLSSHLPYLNIPYVQQKNVKLANLSLPQRTLTVF